MTRPHKRTSISPHSICAIASASGAIFRSRQKSRSLQARASKSGSMPTAMEVPPCVVTVHGGASSHATARSVALHVGRFEVAGVGATAGGRGVVSGNVVDTFPATVVVVVAARAAKSSNHLESTNRHPPGLQPQRHMSATRLLVCLSSLCMPKF